MNQLKALIFDVDGTLAETEREGHRVAFNRAFSEAGLDWCWTEEDYGELLKISGGKERIRYYLHHYQPDVTGNLESLIPQLHQAKTQHYRQILASGEIKLRLGVKRVIEDAYHQGIRLAIATTSALPNALALLEKHLNPDWFDLIAAGDIVANKKPSPEIYEYVLAKMNLTPSECLVFEDSDQGLHAATQANLKTVITTHHYTKDQDFASATLVLDHLGEPDIPFRVLQGEAYNKDYFDLEFAHFLVRVC